VTGNLHVLLALTQAIMSFLPTVGSAAARRSRSIVRWTSDCRNALIERVAASFGDTRIGRTHIDRAGPNTAGAGEVLSP
jgi:hypothetical protein